jgi:hypothetical protein
MVCLRRVTRLRTHPPAQFHCWDSLCVDLGILPVTEGLTAPPFISRVFAFWYPGTESAVAYQITVPPFHLQELQAPLYKAGQGAQVLDMVEPQALYSQSPGSAWARPTS